MISKVSISFVRRPELTRMTGLSQSTLWRLERNGQFPHRRQLSINTVGWIRHEIEEWILKRQEIK
jgi:prophage regulatory protein